MRLQTHGQKGFHWYADMRVGADIKSTVVRRGVWLSGRCSETDQPCLGAYLPVPELGLPCG